MELSNFELLAPAGSYEAMVAAVQNGANAVYLGGSGFGARVFATNFDNEELAKAVKYCHLHNVKVYVTVNTIYNDNQFEKLKDYLNYLYDIQVDAILVQDMGLFDLVKKTLPDIELHISTQASVRTLEGVQYFEKQHVDRVVLSRELNIEEISNICKNTNVDIEVFVHGAICMSYSGQCLMSSMIAKRSGNRGECGQPCRLKYQLKKDNHILKDKEGYLLSPKDLCSIENIGKLIDAGIKSFKIEGRMKRPEYVATVVKAYRQAIDCYLNNTEFNVETNKHNMKQMFNRGFTGGFLFNDKLFVSKDIPGNRGINVGKVVSYNKKSKRVAIKLTNILKQEDRIIFANNDTTRTITKLFLNNRLINRGEVGDIIEIEFNQSIKENTDVFKVIDIDLINEARKSYNKENVKVPVDIKCTGLIGNKLTLEITCGKIVKSYKSDLLIEEAINRPLDKDRLTQQISKLGNTVYSVNKIEVDFPNNGIISIKEVNNLRRKAFEDLDDLRSSYINNKNRNISNIQFIERNHKLSNLYVQVSSFNQYQAVDKKKVSKIIIPYELIDDIDENDYDKLIILFGYLTPMSVVKQFMGSKYYNIFNDIIVSNYGALELLKEKDCILGYNFNVSNSSALNYYKDYDVILSYEMSKEMINNLKCSNRLYSYVYGKPINMNLKHCIISEAYFGYKKDKCMLCKKNNYSLIDRKDEQFDIVTDDYCNNYVLNNRSLYLEHLNNLYIDIAILSFTNESSNIVSQVIDDYYYNILNNKDSEIKTNRDTTTGYFYDN